MEQIGKNLAKYTGFNDKQNELKIIKQKILEITNIEPESLKLKNNILTVECKNNYEALELRLSCEKIINIYPKYKINILSKK